MTEWFPDDLQGAAARLESAWDELAFAAPLHWVAATDDGDLTEPAVELEQVTQQLEERGVSPSDAVFSYLLPPVG